MNMVSTRSMKDQFARVFPDQARALDKADTDEERMGLHEKFVAEAQKELRTVLQKHGYQLGDTDETVPVVLRPALLETMIHARDGEIETQVKLILDGLERLSGMGDNDAIEVSLEIIGFTAAAVGAIAGAVTLTQLLTLSGSFTVSATVAGVAAASVAVVVAIAAFVVLAILIPILYFMNKPAQSIVLLINELDGGPALDQNTLKFVDDYSVHGKPALITRSIPGAYHSEYGTYAYGGLFSAAKKDQALVGSQYGFVMEAAGQKFSFGVTNPLTSIYGDNNCFCAFNESAQSIAEKTDEKNVQFSEAHQGNINMSIRCNSKSGAISWYIARVFND